MQAKLYAVRIFVRDWERALRFYTETLGLDTTFRSDELGWAELDTGEAHLALERAVRVVEHEIDLGHRHGGTADGALEDHVGHFAAAHRRRACLAQHPADGVDHVALTTAIGAHDARQVVVEGQRGAVREGLEPEELEAFQSHVASGERAQRS